MTAVGLAAADGSGVAVSAGPALALASSRDPRVEGAVTGDRAARGRPTTRSSTRGSTRPSEALRRVCARRRADACQVLQRQRVVVAHPARPERHQPTTRRSSTTVDAAIAGASLDRRASRSAPRRGSTSAPRTGRASRSACSAASGWPAARDGKRIKEALERALALDPHAGRRAVRHRALQVLRRHRARGGQIAPLPAAAARRRSGRRA